MNDPEQESKFIMAVIFGVISLIIMLLLNGCAGTAKYTIEHGQTKVTIYNTKDIGELQTAATYNPETGEVKILLDEKSVSASGPQALQNELLRALIPVVPK